jgi:hypothetical protein
VSDLDIRGPKAIIREIFIKLIIHHISLKCLIPNSSYWLESDFLFIVKMTLILWGSKDTPKGVFIKTYYTPSFNEIFHFKL